MELTAVKKICRGWYGSEMCIRDRARAKISTDEAQIEQTQKEAEELGIRTENLQQQIRDLKK